MTGCQMFKQPEIKFPYAPHRAAGRIKPCMVKRHERNMGERKKTRAQVKDLCKYMLFKQSKFMPGKMV